MFLLGGEFGGCIFAFYRFVIPRERQQLMRGDSAFDVWLYADCGGSARAVPCVAAAALGNVAPCPADAFKLDERTFAEIIVRHADTAQGEP